MCKRLHQKNHVSVAEDEVGVACGPSSLVSAQSPKGPTPYIVFSEQC
jgi:hypothetical protein